MRRVERSALVFYTPMQMFRLVEDVPAYPEFLSWCRGAEIHQRDQEHDFLVQLATLKVSFAGMQQQFTTRNRLQNAERVSMSLVDGPFHALSGEWRFVPLGEDGCKISLCMQFDFAHSLLSGAFERGFSLVADRLVQDFSKRADSIYG